MNKMTYRCVAQLGRALRSGRRGRRFKSCRIDSLAGAPESLILWACRSFFVFGWMILEGAPTMIFK